MAVFVADEQTDVAVDTEQLRRLAAFVLADQRVPEAMELSVLCVDREAITELNRHHMGVDRPTDVLAFPMDELRPGGGARGESDGPADPALLGDVVLCPQVAARQAEEAGHSAQDEIELLCTHGILHLLGYDHAEPEEHREMFGLQARLLEGWREVRSSR